MAFPVTAVLDDFNRSNREVDGSWVQHFWGDASHILIVSNQVTIDTAGVSWGAIYYDSSFGPYVESYVDVVTVATGTTLYFCIIVRASGTLLSTPDGYQFYYEGGSSNTCIARFDDGATTVLGATWSQALSNGDKVGVSAFGDKITFYRYTSGAWTEVEHRHDSTYAGAGYSALEIREAGTTQWVFDNFGGGTFVPAAITGTTTASITEADIVAGGKTIIITLEGTTWKKA